MAAIQVSEQLRSTVGKALGRVSSGVFVLSARSPDGSLPVAMLASWVQQVSFVPPAVSVAIARDRPIGPAIAHGGRFALSILGQEDAPLMKRFARGTPDGQDPFAATASVKAPSGLPVLSDALGWLDCRVIEICRFGGDHELFIGEITAGDLLKPGPAFTHQRGNGFHY